MGLPQILSVGLMAFSRFSVRIWRRYRGMHTKHRMSPFIENTWSPAPPYLPAILPGNVSLFDVNRQRKFPIIAQRRRSPTTASDPYRQVSFV